MKTIFLAAAFAAALAACGVGAMTLGRTTAVYAHTPQRAHQVLGRVTVASDTRDLGLAWTDLHGPSLVAEAQERWGRDVDAIVRVRHAGLPNGRGVVTTAAVISYH